MTSPLRRKRPITAQLPTTTSELSQRPAHRGLRRAALAACAALALMPAIDAPLASASEETFRPVSVAATASTSATANTNLIWRARGTASTRPVRQAGAEASAAFLPTGAARQAAALEPAARKTAAAVPSRQRAPREFSSKQSRARMRDSVMQVSTYQDPEKPPFEDTAPAGPLNPNELPEPSDPKPDALLTPETTPADTTPADTAPTDTAPTDTAPPEVAPPAMPSDDPPPAQDLFKDDPIPEPRQPTELPTDEQRQLLDGDMATEPGGPGCENQKDECQRAIHELQKRDITTITVGLLIEGVEGTDFPCDCRLGRDYDAPAFAGRNFAPTLFSWKASGTCHKPLYFEDVQLERYGHSWNPIIQPFMSGAHFFISVPLLPYKMGLRPPNECVYTLGYYRPGNCAPYMFEPIPLSVRAAAAQAAGMTAFAFWFWPPN